MDGLLVVDKPVGPTSHDVVARVRRAVGERRIGHTGTLDPMASGVLALVLGRATRLARFMAADEKQYDAVIHFGVATDTRDATGQPLGLPWSGPWPDRAAIEQALDTFRGTFFQQPPAYSAKKIDGQRSYRLARARAKAAAHGHASAVQSEEDAPETALPAAAEVTAYGLTLTDVAGKTARLEIRCSSGFYVRSLAHDLGAALGVGGHLAALRRTASAGVTLADAVPIEALERDAALVHRALVPMDRMLSGLPAVHLNDLGLRHVSTGRDVGPDGVLGPFPALQTAGSGSPLRVFDAAGRLVAIAEGPTPAGLLHPAVVLM